MEIHRVKHYRHLFFDLDHTLWDFEANSRAVLAELHAEFGLAEMGVDGDAFIPAYEEVNVALWARMEAGTIPKEVIRALRFNQALEQFGLRNAGLAKRLEETYMERCPRRSTLLPGALDLLEDLRKDYRMHIITNGFTEVQGVKMDASGIRGFFDVVLTSEMAGASKPSTRIFRHAMRSAGAKLQESLMIGDNAVADIGGARRAGMDQAHLAPLESGDPQATYRITRLDELRAVLL
ncbi:MAG TPA: YjjG family noncanonical pyrimidine nucleotidase [Flavobacteriales bacterium]|jgi:putative hydrolase of the HAD superfamily|nr:YjjG family noncanonical pyrimidine nucleotidase [Flavobacteriales bacterium]HRA17633.1 YjjG family noncanonical pyrimidine nucleotidase [Flavobacteriales bacterium]